MHDVTDLLNEQRGDSLQILFHESRSHPKTFPGKRQRNKQTIERRGFSIFASWLSEYITPAYLDWLSSSVIDIFPVNAQRYRNKRILEYYSHIAHRRVAYVTTVSYENRGHTNFLARVTHYFFLSDRQNWIWWLSKVANNVELKLHHLS